MTARAGLFILATCAVPSCAVQPGAAQDAAKAATPKLNALGISYPTACQVAYFFEHYQKAGKLVYRDKWRGFLKDEYTGEHLLKSWGDDSAVTAFKDDFGIKTDQDSRDSEK